jgi:hypothetical protein
MEMMRGIGEGTCEVGISRQESGIGNKKLGLSRKVSIFLRVVDDRFKYSISIFKYRTMREG